MRPNRDVLENTVWGREAEVQLIWESLKKQNVSLTAGPKMGKTAILRKISQIPDPEWIALYVDLGHSFTHLQFILALLEKARGEGFVNKTSQRVKKFLHHVDHFAGAAKVAAKLPDTAIEMKLKNDPQGWRDCGYDLLWQISDNIGTKRLIFLLDGFSLMLSRIINKNPSAAEELLHWLKEIRADSEIGQKFHFLITASSGMSSSLKRHKLGNSINDLNNIILKGYSRETAESFVKNLLISEGLYTNEGEIESSVIDTFLSYSGNVPYFIKMLAAELTRACNEASAPVSVEVIHRAYREGVLGRERGEEFEAFYERLKDSYSPKDREAALVLINEIARQKEAGKDELYRKFCSQTNDFQHESFAHIMNMLEGDFYILSDSSNQTYSFQFEALADWWRKYKINEFGA